MAINDPRKVESKREESAMQPGAPPKRKREESSVQPLRRRKLGTQTPTSPSRASQLAARSSVAMAEMPPHGANQAQPPPPLPPGVYFSPTRMECLEILNRWIAGDREMRDMQGYIFRANVYGEGPDALRRRHPPASIRERAEDTWWVLSETKFQSKDPGGGASKRADRHVETGGFWRLEQSKEKLDDDGFKNTFGFYVDAPKGNYKSSKKKDKTPWLMQEFTSANDDGTGKQGVPALYRVYLTPRASDDEQREAFGEDGVKRMPDGRKKPARAMVVPEEYFDAVTALLPEGSVRDGGVGQEHLQPPPLPPVEPQGLVGDFYSQQEHYLGQYHQQQQQGQPPPLPPAVSEGLLLDYCGQQEQYLGPYEQQQDEHLGQYQQQQQVPLSVVAPPLPPPASPGLLAELPPSDNLSMPMDELMSMLNDNEQPAETVKGEEPNWESLDDIVDADELADFNKEG